MRAFCNIVKDIFRYIILTNVKFRKENLRSSQPLLLCDYMSCYVRAGSQPSPDTKSWSWAFQPPQTVRNKFVLFTSHPVYGISVTATQTD